MNQVDKISKEALDLLRYAKDTAKSNLVTANGQLESKLSDEQLSTVLSIVDSSLNQGYQKGLTSFQNSVKNIVAEDSSKRRK